MSQELVYTSVPRGLAPGSHGFCTVACTRGIAVNLQQQLESLSGYRALYPPQDPNVALNPVVFSHLLLSLAGRRCHVLSRVCDAGLDYTQRTNKFAHHVVLDAAEVPAAGPAWLLARPGFMRRAWEGEPCMLPSGPAIPKGDCPPSACRAWQQIAGDAGWGGVLAETATAGRQATLIFRPGTDALALLGESLLLLPADVRWRVTFSTYFTKLPPGVACQWRCVADGTPEATAARNAAGAQLVIDLCRPASRPPAGPYVDYARSGKRSPPRPPAGGEADFSYQLAGEVPTSAGAGSRLPSSFVDNGSLAPPAVPVRPPAFEAQQFEPKRPRRWPWVLLMAASLVIMFVAGGTVVWFVRGGPTSRETATNAGQDRHDPRQQNLGGAAKETPEASAAEKKAAEDKKIGQEKVAADKKAAEVKAAAAKATEDNRAAEEKAAADKKAAEEKAAAAKAAEDKKAAEEKAAPDKKASATRSERVLEPSKDLPAWSGTGFGGLNQESSVILAEDCSTITSLALIGGEGFGPATRYEICKDGNAWCCLAIRAATPGVDRREDKMARLTADREGLHFSWLSPDLDRAIGRDQLRNCLLRITKNGQQQTLQLRIPDTMPPARLKALGPSGYLPLPKLKWMPEAKNLRLTLDIDFGQLKDDKIVKKDAGGDGTWMATIDSCVHAKIDWDRDCRLVISCTGAVALPGGNAGLTICKEESPKRIAKLIEKKEQQLFRKSKERNALATVGKQRKLSREDEERYKELEKEIEDTAHQITDMKRVYDLCQKVQDQLTLRARLLHVVKDNNGRELHVVLARPAD